MSANQKPVTAFILSMLSGLFIILGGSLWCLWLGANWGVDWMDWMMHGWNEHMHLWNLQGVAYPLGIIAIIFGIIVLIAAVMLYTNPTQHELWGALIIVFSVLSMLGCMGGMGIGILLGIAGGILAILWRPKKT